MGIGATLAFAALALLAEVAGTVGGFGSSVFFVPIANWFFPFTTVLGLVSLFHLASNASKLALFRGGIDRALLLRLGVPSVLCAFIGAWAGTRLPTAGLELGLGVFLVVVSGLFLLRPAWRLPADTRTAVAAGAVSGGAAGLVGTGGAVRGLAMAAFGLPKQVFVATSAAIDMGIDVVRAATYVAHGYVQLRDLAWMPLLAVIAFAGSAAGRAILARVPQARFRALALWLVLAIGVASLATAGWAAWPSRG